MAADAAVAVAAWGSAGSGAAEMGAKRAGSGGKGERDESLRLRGAGPGQAAASEGMAARSDGGSGCERWRKGWMLSGRACSSMN